MLRDDFTFHPECGRTRDDLRRKAQQLHDCSADVMIRDYFEVGRRSVHANRCRHHLVCPTCAIFRGARVAAATCERFAALRRQAGPMRLYLLTLTMLPSENIRDQLCDLLRWWRELWMRRKPSGRHAGTPLNLVTGGQRAVEIKRGSGSGLFHTHVHSLVLAHEALPVVQHDDGSWRWPALSNWWQKRTGAKIVECHPVTPSLSIDPREDAPCGAAEIAAGDGLTTHADTTQLMGAILELSKYAVKLNALHDGDLLNVWGAAAGRRMVDSFGCLRGLDRQYERQQADDDRAFLDVCAYAEMCYRWSAAAGYSLTGARVVPDSIPFG